MKALLKYSCILGGVLVAGNASAQPGAMNQDRMTTQAQPKQYVAAAWAPSLVPDGMIDRVEDRSNRTLEWHNIREIDIAFKRRLWKRIDINEKQNMPFIFVGDEYSGGGAFIEILVDAARKGRIRAFTDDKFTSVLTPEQIDEKVVGASTTLQVEDPETGEMTTQVIEGSFNPEDIFAYEVQEDWMFDRNIGRLVPRLRALSPLMHTYNEATGERRGFKRLFTIYYPEARQELSKYEVYNPQNDLHRITWTDYLDRMQYSAYTIKSSRNNPSNVNNMGQAGLEALINGDKEMQDLIQREMDMWEL
jgi:gliding motility associated protien GldN